MDPSERGVDSEAAHCRSEDGGECEKGGTVLGTNEVSHLSRRRIRIEDQSCRRGELGFGGKLGASGWDWIPGTRVRNSER